MPRINLLPWRDQQRRERKLAFFIALGVAAGVAAVVAFAAYLLVGSMVDAQERRNERLRAQIRVLDKQIEQKMCIRDRRCSVRSHRPAAARPRAFRCPGSSA